MLTFKRKDGSPVYIIEDIDAVAAHGEGETALYINGGIIVVAGTPDDALAVIQPKTATKPKDH